MSTLLEVSFYPQRDSKVLYKPNINNTERRNFLRVIILTKNVSGELKARKRSEDAKWITLAKMAKIPVVDFQQQKRLISVSREVARFRTRTKLINRAEEQLLYDAVAVF